MSRRIRIESEWQVGRGKAALPVTGCTCDALTGENACERHQDEPSPFGIADAVGGRLVDHGRHLARRELSWSTSAFHPAQTFAGSGFGQVAECPVHVGEPRPSSTHGGPLSLLKGLDADAAVPDIPGGHAAIRAELNFDDYDPRCARELRPDNLNCLGGRHERVLIWVIHIPIAYPGCPT